MRQHGMAGAPSKAKPFTSWPGSKDKRRKGLGSYHPLSRYHHRKPEDFSTNPTQFSLVALGAEDQIMGYSCQSHITPASETLTLLHVQTISRTEAYKTIFQQYFNGVLYVSSQQH